MKTIRHLLRFALASLFVLIVSSHAAPPSSPPTGHWEGAINLPNLKLAIAVDFVSSGEAGAWAGTIDIPTQGLRGFKLSEVSVENPRMSFRLPGIPGDPTFDGKFADSGNELTGDFRQGGQTFPFSLAKQTATAASNRSPAPAPESVVPGKGLVGHWQGALSVSPGIALRLVLHIAADAAGTLTATLDSPDQGAKDIPVASVTLANDAVRIDLARLQSVYEGKLSANGAEIEGRWKQGPNDLPLVFRRLASAPTASRPQEPKKPYPYQEQSVTFPGGTKDVTLAGTLTLPAAEGPFAAVVLATGTGPQERDEPLWGHRPFLVLADHLTRQGIAVLRFDDRGVGRSTGNFAAATHEDFVADLQAAFRFLRSQPGIDPKRVGLCGHSEGGLHVMIAAADEKEVAFAVSLAGMAVPLDQLLLRQRQDFLRISGMEGKANPEGRKLSEQMYALLRQRGATAETRAELRGLFRQNADFYPPEQREAMGFSDAGIEQTIATMTSPWFVKLLAHDAATTFARASCPVLALNGERDIQVAAGENLEAIRVGLAAGGNTAVTIRALPGLNHLFQRSTTGLPTEYGTIDETMSPEVLTLVSDWIRQRR